jgi:hypothetical protein
MNASQMLVAVHMRARTVITVNAERVDQKEGQAALRILEVDTGDSPVENVARTEMLNHNHSSAASAGP